MHRILLSLIFIININTAHGFVFRLFFEEGVSQEQKERIERIAVRVEEVVITPEFANLAKSEKFKCFDRNNLPRGVQNIDDVLVDIAQKDAIIRIAFFTSNNSVVGSTSGNLISFNTTFFDRNEDARVANTLFHEALHSVGYGHCGKNNIRFFPKIKKSVPYRFGQFVQSLF